MRQFEVEIITPDQAVFKGRTHSLIVPAYEGYLGVMAGHSPFMGLLTAGRVTIRSNELADPAISGGTSAGRSTGKPVDTTLSITGGFIEVANNKVVILTE